MFVFVTVQAEQFPVAAILGVVVVIMIAMMHGEFGQVAARELASAAPAYPGIQFECALAVGADTRLTFAPCPRD